MLLNSLIETIISIMLYMALGSGIGLLLLFLYPNSPNDKRSILATTILFNGLALNVILIAAVIVYALNTYSL